MSKEDYILLALEWFVNPDHLPIFAAKEKGFFKEEGIDLSLVVPTAAEESLKLVGLCKADFGVGEQSNLILNRSKGLPLISTGPLLEHTVVVFMYLEGSGIKEVKDLKGKKIGWPGIDIDVPFIEAVTEHAGLKKEEYSLVSVGFHLTDALLSKEVDAVFGAFQNFEGVEAELRGARIGLFQLPEHGVPDMYQLIFFTNPELAKKNPDLCKRFMKALSKGMEMTIKNPDDALKSYYKLNPGLESNLSKKTFEATLPFFARTMTQSEERWANVQDFLYERGVIKKKTAMKELFTNQFV